MSHDTELHPVLHSGSPAASADAAPEQAKDLRAEVTCGNDDNAVWGQAAGAALDVAELLQPNVSPKASLCTGKLHISCCSPYIEACRWLVRGDAFERAFHS